MLIASARYLASRQAWIQSQPGSHFVSVNQTSKLFVWQSARPPASEGRQSCDYFLRSFVPNASPLYSRRLRRRSQETAEIKSACERAEAKACARAWRLTMDPSVLNSTPLTCHSATEVMLITKPNTIAKLSFSALCVRVCVCLCEMTVQGFREQWARERIQVVCVCRHMCVLGFRYQDMDWELIGLEITTELSIFSFLKRPSHTYIHTHTPSPPPPTPPPPLIIFHSNN